MAIPGEPVAVEVLGIGAQQIADALLAHATDGVAPEPCLAELAVSAFRVEETFETLAGVRVAVAGVVIVPVVAAVARNARPARNFRIAVIVVRADGATQS